jgi:DNA-binding MarR family transcriptional regulator/N-acetylglutamate synthase-like GNAT family acetyltransferase
MVSPAKASLAPGSVDPVHAVRRFNRFYTRQIGVLQEHLLKSPFSLSQVRVLYELAQRNQVTAAELCNDLGLDRGYLSRMLRGFAAQALIKTLPSPDDRRRLFLSLTKKGREVFDPLDRRSSDEVSAMLARLSSPQQTRLLAAMREIEEALAPKHSAGQSWTLRKHQPGDMGWVVNRHGVLYSQEYGYDQRFEALVAEIVAHFVHHFDPQREACWIAERNGESLGCIFLVKKSKTVGQLRLLLVEPSARGLGIGTGLVAECVRFGREAGYKKIVLWTQSELQAARCLYQRAGFKLTAEEKHDSWSRKDLLAQTWELKL